MKEELIQLATLQQSKPWCAHCTRSVIRAAWAWGGDAPKLPAARPVYSLYSLQNQLRAWAQRQGPEGSKEREDKQEPGDTSVDPSAGHSYTQRTNCGDRNGCPAFFLGPWQTWHHRAKQQGAPLRRVEPCPKATGAGLVPRPQKRSWEPRSPPKLTEPPC